VISGLRIPSDLGSINRNARSLAPNGRTWVVIGVGSTRPSSRSLSRRAIRSRPPGQRPVRIVVSPMPTPQSSRGIRTYSPSPWYPTLEIVPPGPVTHTQLTNVASAPSASIAESTPTPPVRARISATGSPAEKSITCVAPYCRASSWRPGTDSTARMSAAPRRRAPTIAMRRAGPAANTATDPPTGGFACSALMNPIDILSHAETASASGTASGIGARFAIAWFTWKYSASAPSFTFPNFHPPSSRVHWDGYPRRRLSHGKHGVMAFTATR
jgi:hypothetical protein